MIAAPSIEQRPLPDLPDRLPAELHPVLRRVLLARGIHTPEQLQLDLERLLTPDALGGIDAAAARLADAVTGDERILVVGDFDADGATGTALAVRALRAMGAAQVDFRVPNRFEFGYGLTPALVDTLSDDPPEVLVTVDSGICCNAGVARATALGCSVIVTDHHLPGETLPEATAIVNPNLPGDGFGSKALAGVGVVFYLVAALRAELRGRGWFGAARRAPQVSQWLDLVALGTVADLVPLDHNNRVLVEQGLARIRAGHGCEGIMALLRVAGRDYRHAVAADLGFAVAPRLNAAGRLEDMAVGIRCLLTDDPDAAARLAGTLDGLNRERRALQEVMQDEAMAQVRTLLEDIAGRSTLPPGLCLFDARWHQGVVGL
ncbi:MAG: DHH family phosphoesterase, partial [Xanthomonadales bacterium]|nr:DHH family phosphoesterase [Xanthomonadales bacterium]